MTSIQAAALWTGLLILLVLVLAVLVVRWRLRGQVALGDGDVPELARAIRVHGNAVEYIAPCVAGLAVMALSGLPAWTVHVAGALLFGGRVAHAVGLSASAGPTPGRQAGMVATWAGMAWIAGACLVAAF